MADNKWQAARLIPTSGISGPEEAERRATSALLAVMSSVRDFGQAITKPLGAPAGQIEAFIEVPFELGERTVIPDGLLQTTRAGKTWTALVEVKTGTNGLTRDQVECYLDVARTQGYDVVLTISNQIPPAPGVHPVDVSKAKLRKVQLHHLSWAEILTIAVTQRVHRGVSDPDQAWILGELIRYLEHPKSGALDFSDMGAAWVPVREAVAAGTLRVRDKGLPEVVSRWEQLLRFVALRLGRELGANVQVVTGRGEPGKRLAQQAKSLVENGTLTGSLRIPGAAADLEIVADVRAARVIASAEIAAPKEGRPQTRVNWLVRQLDDAPGGLRIDGLFAGTRTSTSELLRVVRENPSVLLDPAKRDFRAFRVAAASAMGTKRGTGRASFIDSVLAAVDGFYEAVLQRVRPWTPRAPQLPRGGRTAAESEGLDLTPPPGDLAESDDSAEPAVAPGDEEAPDERPEPTEGERAATLLSESQPPPVPTPEGSASRGPVESDVVVWDAAEQRLDREREHQGPDLAD